MTLNMFNSPDRFIMTQVVLQWEVRKMDFEDMTGCNDGLLGHRASYVVQYYREELSETGSV
jgi:hypothetical protein